MACGTGKTLTSLFVRENLAAERTLVLVPSLSLMKQTMHVWTASAKVPFDKLPVCSDQTVGRSNDDAAVAHTSELGLPVTTDPRAIAAFLRRRSGPRVVFATYQSSPQIASAFALGRVPAFDLVVADEAHRIAGPQSSDFATVLDNTQIRARKRLFMTATPRYFTGRVTQAAQGVDLEVASMDDTTRPAASPASGPETTCARPGTSVTNSSSAAVNRCQTSPDNTPPRCPPDAIVAPPRRCDRRRFSGNCWVSICTTMRALTAR